MLGGDAGFAAVSGSLQSSSQAQLSLLLLTALSLAVAQDPPLTAQAACLPFLMTRLQ